MKQGENMMNHRALEEIPRRIVLGKRAATCLVLSLWLSGTLAGTSLAQCEVEKFITNTTGKLGTSVDVSGEWAAAGAPIASTGGAVRMYRRDDAGTPSDPTDDTWLFHSELVHDSPASGDRFGASVSINGTYLVVGAPERDIGALLNAGSVYVFRFDGTNWVQNGQALTAIPDAAGSAYFGWSVAVSKGPSGESPIVVAGAPYEQYSPFISGGTAYVFRWNSFAGKWSRQVRLIPTDVSNYINFGWSVAASFGEGIDRIVVGAPYSNPTQGPGAAYVFEDLGENTWQEMQRLSPSASNSLKIGASVAIATSETLGTDQIVVGATSGQDRLYLYSRDQGSVWQEQLRITPPPFASSSFAKDVASSGDAILVSDRGYIDPEIDSGAAHLYLRTGTSWADPPVLHTLQPPDAVGFDTFGESVGLDGVSAVVGSNVLYSSGGVYFYAVTPDYDGDGFADICDNCPLVANGLKQSTCIAGTVTPCTTHEECDTSVGALDGICSLPMGICLAGLAFECLEDVDCDGGPGSGDGTCEQSQSDGDNDGFGDVCDNCPIDDNPNQADYNQNGMGDVCDPAYSIGDELMPPRECSGGADDGLNCRTDDDCSSGGVCMAGPGYETVDVNATAQAHLDPTCVGGTSHGKGCVSNGNCPGGVCGSVSTQIGVFYYDKVYGKAIDGWEGRFFVNEPGVVAIQWLTAAGQPTGDPVTYFASDSIATPPTNAPYAFAGVRFFYNMATNALVTIDTTFEPTIRFNSTYLVNDPPTTPSDILIRPGDDGFQVNNATEGKVVIQYTDGAGGALAGLEVVNIREFVAVGVDFDVDVGRKLDIPDGADCRALFVENASDGGGFPAAWQRSEATLDIWPIREEITSANLVVAWYESSPITPNCWHNAIRRYSSHWPTDVQEHIVVADAVPDPAVVQLPVGDEDVYCGATVMFPDQFTPPQARVVGGNLFTASQPGYAVIRFDTKGPEAGSTCLNNRVDVNFEVILVHNHSDPAVASGPVAAPIGTQLDDVEHDTNAPLYPFGHLYVDWSTQPSPPCADNIYQATRQIIPVNTSAVHGLLEAWWYEEGAYAPGIHWPHKVVTYDAQWPSPANRLNEQIVIASRLGAGAYPNGASIYNVGVFNGPSDIPGWNPNDEHARLLPFGGNLRAFAVRDDDPWNVTSGHPYVLVQYDQHVCSTGQNSCLSEADCTPGESCDPNGLHAMGVHAVIGEEQSCPDPLSICFDYSDFQFECVDCTCDVDNTCIDSPRDGDVCDSHDDCARLPVVAGLPIDPLFPVNIGAAPCLDETTSEPLTNVVGDGLWVDRKGGIWAAEEETDDAVPVPSTGTIYLWENWVGDRSCQPWRGYYDGGPLVTPWPIVYRPSWPPYPPACTYPTDPACARPLQVGERVNQTDQVGPIEVLHDSVGIRIIDPTHEAAVPLADLPSDVEFQQLPPHLFGGEIGGGGEWPDRIRFESGELFFRGIMSDRDRDLLKELSVNAAYLNAMDQLYTESRFQLTVRIPNPVEKWVSVAHPESKPGWITLAFQNDEIAEDLPISVEVWRVDCPPHVGIIRPLQPTCPFNEKLVMQHSVDGGGEPENLIYQWQWSVDYDPAQPGLAIWNEYDPSTEFADGAGLREVIIGGASPFTLSDSWWRVRYRGFTNCPCGDGGCNDQGVPWALHLADDGTSISDWTDPQLAEGWVKRVVRGINPFDQRVDDFHLTEVSTYVDMISQAGPRSESPVALNCTPSNINDLGLIEVYETVARRARSFSIDVGNAFDPAMLAILLVTAKVNDLYTMLGNEAFADASDPTIGLFAEAGEPPLTYDPHAVFSFQDQMPTILEEELAMLRGRDTVRPPDLDGDGNIIATVYNRLEWNFTSGNGQVAYANNYQVTNVLDARDLYPQGHGDAWGHYLTATKKFYTLLRHPVFDWIVSTESVLVAGQPVQVGFQYERAFAKAAAAKARTGAAITSATFRQKFNADPTQQNGYPDTDPARAWGVVDWARRAGQGAYFDWAMTNALLDDVDDDPAHENTIQKIDRTTINELREMAAAYSEIQSALDNADVGLNPLGLAANVVPFGLNPSEIEQGKTHFEQVYERALAALGNAVTAFDYANENSRRLRSQQDKVEEFTDLVDERELDFKSRLVEVYGRPYDEDVGPTGAYPSGYDGPDYLHFDYVEPTRLLGIDPSGTTTITRSITDRSANINTGVYEFNVRPVEFHVSTDGLGLVKPSWWGARPEPGEIQFARSELLQTMGRYVQAIEAYEAHVDQAELQIHLLTSLYEMNAEVLTVMQEGFDYQKRVSGYIKDARTAQLDARRSAALTRNIANSVLEAFPIVQGVLVIDVFGIARSTVLAVTDAIAVGFEDDADAETVKEVRKRLDLQLASAEQQIQITGWEGNYQVEQQIAVIRQLFRALPGMRLELYALEEAINQAAGRYHAALGKGVRLLEQRTAFRQKTARDISQYRYRDLAFRIFRNDALQKYRAQFELAARYAFLAARSFDYETNLLGTDSDTGRGFLENVVKERVLGVVSDGTPQIGNGLAGLLADLATSWGQAKPQLGFNSPDELHRTFSLRWELYRKPNSIAYDSEWRDILSSYVVSDINALTEYRQYCQPLQPPIPNNPAIVIPIGTTVQSGLNFFGWPSTGDATLPSDRFAIKMHDYGIRFADYPGFPLNQQVNAYLVPVGTDILRTPSCPEAPIREWHLLDQTLPVPLPISVGDLQTVGWIPWDALDGGSAAMVRRRLIPTVAACAADDPTCTDMSFKLTGRSVWNTRWILIIPGSELMGADPAQGVDIFINGSGAGDSGVRDIKLILNSYGYSGCVSSAASSNADALPSDEQEWPTTTGRNASK